MRTIRTGATALAVTLVFPLTAGIARAATARGHRVKRGAEAATAHVMVAPEDIKWQAFPPGGPGAEIAVLAGDPSKPGPYVMRIKTPPGRKIPPHWHPADENITVIQGPAGFGAGEKFDEAAGREFPTGSYLLMPRHARHFAWGKGEVIVQVHGQGPFKVFWVNPADDPARQAAPAAGVQ